MTDYDDKMKALRKSFAEDAHRLANLPRDMYVDGKLVRHKPKLLKEPHDREKK